MEQQMPKGKQVFVLLALVLGTMSIASCRSMMERNPNDGHRELTAWQLEIALKDHPLPDGWSLSKGGSGKVSHDCVYLRHETTPLSYFLHTPEVILSLSDSAEGECVGRMDRYKVHLVWCRGKEWAELRDCVKEVLSKWHGEIRNPVEKND